MTRVTVQPATTEFEKISRVYKENYSYEKDDF